uniref:Uncharacterized protein n=1 Tax=Arundo donax TaxID=35708 RepID=A0A0A8XNL0_ARUDO
MLVHISMWLCMMLIAFIYLLYTLKTALP